jgi:alpha-1,2-mannosyltransferase
LDSGALAHRENVLVATIGAILIASLCINLVLHVYTPTGVETVWTHEGRFLRSRQGADSWKAMEAARAYAREHSQGLYEHVFFADAVKFQYPPTALLLIGDLERPALNRISWMATLIAAGLAAAILRRAIGTRWGRREPQPRVGIARDALVVIAALTFYPLIKAYSLGQIQAWLNTLFAILVLTWMMNAKALAGAALGLMCLVKPTYGLLYLWGLLRREMRFVVSGVLVIAVGLAMSLWRYGLHDHLEYLQVLSFIARRGESFYPNQSINGLLNRALFNGSNLEWQAHEFAPVNPVVYAGSMIALVALGAASLRRPERSAGSAIDLAIATLWLTVTAPVAWEHHYGILVPIYAAVSPFVIVQRPVGRFTGPTIALSYLVASNYFQFTNRFADTRLNPLQSYLLGAALLLWLLLYRSVHARVDASVATAASFDRQDAPRARRAALAGLSVWRRPFRSRSS